MVRLDLKEADEALDKFDGDLQGPEYGGALLSRASCGPQPSWSCTAIRRRRARRP